MNTIREVNTAMQLVLEQMAITRSLVSDAREKYHEAKAFYENEYSRLFLTTRATDQDLTMQEVKAKATTLSYNDKLEMIKAESTYQKALNMLKGYETEYEGLINMGYNLRQELKNLGGSN
jgi:hypothetical protein